MALTLTDLQNRFKKIGKLIYLFQNAPAMAVELKRIHVATVDQLASTYSGGEDDSIEFDLTDQAINPLGSQVKTTTDQIKALPAQAKSAADTILRQFLAVDLGLAKGASYATLGPALVAAMNSVGASVAPTTGNPNGIAAWFATNFNLNLPTNATPTIPDAWITDEVV